MLVLIVVNRIQLAPAVPGLARAPPPQVAPCFLEDDIKDESNVQKSARTMMKTLMIRLCRHDLDQRWLLTRSCRLRQACSGPPSFLGAAQCVPHLTATLSGGGAARTRPTSALSFRAKSFRAKGTQHSSTQTIQRRRRRFRQRTAQGLNCCSTLDLIKNGLRKNLKDN